MQPQVIWMLVAFGALALGFIIGLKLTALRGRKQADEDRERLLAEARKEADAIRQAAEHEAKETVLKEQEKVDREHKASLGELKKSERGLAKREGELNEMVREKLRSK